MKAQLVMDHKFIMNHEGKVYSSLYNYDFWKRYLKIFDGLKIISRIKISNYIPKGYYECGGNGVIFKPIQYYKGFEGFCKNLNKIVNDVKANVSSNDALIFRGFGPICMITWILNRNRYPYAIELIGDPYDVFRAGAIKHPLRPIFKLGSYLLLKKAASEATCVIYVTKQALQKRYPCKNRMLGASDIVLPEDAVLKNQGISLIKMFII